MKKLIISICISFIFLSCNFINFSTDSVTIHPDSNASYFNGEYISFTFSGEMKHYYVENAISLKKDNTACNISFNWKSDSLLEIKPEKNWNPGSLYQCEIEGTIYKKDGRSFSVSEECSFYYGIKSNRFKLLSYPESENTFMLEDSVTFVFSYPVNRVDFENAFTINPNTNYQLTINDDKTAFTINPIYAWKLNQTYKWNFKNLNSAENFTLQGLYEGEFKTLSDTEIPKLIKTCPVTYENENQIWQTEFQLNKNIRKKEAIGFIFSKPMNFSSIKKETTFTPSITGYFITASEDLTKFIFIPEENYSIETEYVLTLSKSLTDKNEIPLGTVYKESFYSADSYLKIESVLFGNNLYDFEELKNYTSTSIPVTITKDIDNNTECTIAILFSNAINEDKLLEAEDFISLSLLFPLTSVNPVKTNVTWDSSRKKISLTWKKMTCTTSEVDSYYNFKIVGNKNGLSTGNGNYLKDDLCVTLSFL